MDVLPFFRHLTGCICNVFEGYSSVLFLRDIEGHYKIASYFSLGDNINASTTVKKGRGILGWILKNKQPLVINDFSREKRTLPYYFLENTEKVKSFMGVPLKREKGILCVDSKKTYTFTPKDQKILIQFTELIDSFLKEREQLEECIWIQNYYNALKIICGLKEKYPRWDNYLTQLLRVLSLNTGFSRCIFASRDEKGTGYYLEKYNEQIKGLEGLEGKKFPINNGIIGWVFKNHKLVVLDEDDKPRPIGALVGKHTQGDRFQTIVCIPLIVNFKTRGVLVFLDENKKHITNSLTEFFNLLNCHLSLFLENLYLKNKLRKKTKGY